MAFRSTVKPVILVYELLRVFALCATRVGRPLVTLPATWYAAVPLLVLPFILQLLCQLERDHAAVYRRLYLITKGLSVLGCLIYFARISISAYSETNGIDSFAFWDSKSFANFSLFLSIDVILLLLTVLIKLVLNVLRKFRKRRIERKKRKGGAQNASFD